MTVTCAHCGTQIDDDVKTCKIFYNSYGVVWDGINHRRKKLPTVKMRIELFCSFGCAAEKQGEINMEERQ